MIVRKVVAVLGEKLGIDLAYFVKNGTWVMVRQIVSIVTGLLLSVAFARLVTQEVFGQYQLLLSLLSFVSILSIPGLNVSLVRSVAKGYDGDYRKAVRVSFFWSMLGIPILLMLGGYYYIYDSQALGVALMIAAAFFPLLYAPNTWDSFLQGKGRFDIAAQYSIVQMVVNAIAIGAVIAISRDRLVAIVVTYLVSYTFFNVYYFVRSLRYVAHAKESDDMIEYGWFLTKINVLGLLAGNIDKVLVGTLLGPRELAVYTIVSVIAIKVKDVLKVLNSLLLPKIAQQSMALGAIIRQHWKVIVATYSIIGFFAYVYYLTIPWINAMLFSNAYATFSYLSQIFTLTIIVAMPLSFLGYYNAAKKHKRSILFSNALFYLIKIGLSVVLIGLYGVLGAVVAFNLSMVVWLLLYVISTTFSEKRRVSAPLTNAKH